MHSIRARMTSLTLVALLICVVAIGGITLLSARRANEHNAELTMDLICENTHREMEDYLTSIERSADMGARFIDRNLDIVALAEGGVIGATGDGDSLGERDWDSPRQAALDAYLKGHLKAVDDAFNSIVGRTDKALSYFYRINPEISRDCPGFWYTRFESTEFDSKPLTDLSAYKINDYAHVGWYYLPLERGRPSWLEPYYNEALDIQVVTYTVPIYRAGTFIGIIGMDIDYATLEGLVQDLGVLDTGYAFLTDENGCIIYHPLLAGGVMLSDVNAELKDTEGRLSQAETSAAMIEYTFNGVKKRAVWRTLSNGLRLFVAVPTAELNADWNRLFVTVIAVAAAIMALFALLTLSMARRVTRPLEWLTVASQQLSSGNYDVELDYDGDDEVGILTQSFKHLVDHLKVFIADLNSRANKDALTGVKNKSAFDIYSAGLDEAIGDPERAPRFAVAMFDCNYLKVINDSYGHDKGDIYLRTACMLICKVFAHSPVFRVGGDEFVSILQQDDLENLEALRQRFWDGAASVNRSAENLWDRISLAMGIARFDPARDHSVEDVLHRADEAMYLNKRTMKESGSPR